jgi:serine/threonine protein kinase/tetratricopeptide (TPR) repeat protein
MPDTITITPTLYGKYQLLEQLARGGMAEVFKAKAHGVEGFEKILVIKRILPELSQNPRFVEMFINEAKIAVTLSHANIVQVFDLGQAQDTYFIAMEFVAGMDLATTLKLAARAQRRLSAELAVYIVSELAKGLDYAHRRRDGEQRSLHIVHRDVSPQNVLLSQEGEVKLTDFGIAKARMVAQSVTDVGVVKGKYAYMSPEQIMGKPVDARADVFAAGVLLYEALAGTNPFQTNSNYDTLQRIRSGEITPIEQLVPDVPPEVSRVVRIATAFDPDERYASAEHLYEDLIQYLYGTGRRFGARDLSEFLSHLRASGGDDARAGEGLRAAFEVESVTGFENEMPERTKVGRARRTTRETPTGSKKGRDTTPHRERTEWRDVTALSLRRAPDDKLKPQTIGHIVERFGGHLVYETGMPAPEVTQIFLFGVHNPDGRDTQSASLCALRISRAASAVAAEAGRSTSVALGIHAGRVLVDLAGGLVRDRHHDAVLAHARELTLHSGSSQILVNDDAEKILRNYFRLVPAGQQAEGAFLLASERSVAEVYGRFIGRRQELKTIGESLARASRGELRVLGLSGEAGSGKTRLLVETTRRLGLAGHNVGLHVATLTLQMARIPLSAIQAMLRAVLGVDEFDAEALLRDRTTRLRELGLLSAEQTAVAAALGLDPGGRPHVGHRPLRAALLRIIRKLAEDRLTIFAWDGAEHMDPDSQAIMDDMLSTVSEARVAVILGYRPPHRPGGAELPNFVEIRLGALTDEELARLTATRLGADEIPLELLREVTSKSGGNPLYAEEHLKALIDSSAIRFDDGQVRFNAAVADVAVPKTLRGIVASRIDRLGPLQRYVLQVAAIAGERWNSEIVAAAAQEEPRAVLEAVHARDMQGVVQRVGPDEYTFAHGLVRQVVLEGTTVQARREIHAAITDAIIGLYPNRLDELAERLARHHLEAGQHDAAVDALVRAAHRFERESAGDEAIAALQRAADILAMTASPDRERMFRIYEEIAELCFRNRDLELGAELMHKALKAAESHKADHYVARFCVWLGRMLVSASRIEEGRRWLDQAQHVTRGLTDAGLARDVFIAKADADARSGEFEKAVGALKEAYELARTSEDRLAELGCLMPLALTYARMADHASAMQTLAEVQRLAELQHDPLIAAQVLRLESQIHYHARDPEAVARASARAMEICREANLFYEGALNAHNMGEAFLRLSDYRRAFAALRSSYEIATEHGYTRLQMSNMRFLGFIDATRFNSTEGRSRLIQAIDYAIEHDYVWDIIQGKYLLAIVHQGRGELDSARAALREVLDLAAQHGHRKYTEDSEQALRELDAGVPIALPA